MKTLCARFEDQDAEQLRALSDKQGKTLADVLKEYVLQGMHSAPQPAPNPAPRPAPTDPGQGAAKLPEAIVNRIAELVSDRLALRACLTACRAFLWGPKAAAVAACAIAIFTHKGRLAYACCWIWLATVVLDALWVGRERKCEVLERAVDQLWELISRVPDAYRELCRSKTPDAAEAEVLAMIQEARGRVGQFGMNDVGISSWNP